MLVLAMQFSRSRTGDAEATLLRSEGQEVDALEAPALPSGNKGGPTAPLRRSLKTEQRRQAIPGRPGEARAYEPEWSREGQLASDQLGVPFPETGKADDSLERR